MVLFFFFFFFQAEDGIRDLVRSRGLGDVYKRQLPTFLRGFNVEDLILYVFSLLTLVIFAIFFYQHYVTTVPR